MLLAATLVGNALLLLLDMYVNGVLGVEAYGLFATIKRVVMFVGFVALLGMENAVIRFVAAAATPGAAVRAVRVAMGGTLAASTAAAAAVIVFAGPLAAYVDPAPETADALRIAAISLPLASVRTVAVAASQGWKAIWPRALVMFIAWPIVQFIGVGLLVQALGFGVIGMVWAYVGAMAVGAGLAVATLLRMRPEAAVADGPGLRALLAFSWPMWAQGVLMAAYTWIDQILLAAIRSPADAGIYGPVVVLGPLFGLGLGALNGQFAPMIAEKHAQGDIDGLRRLYRTATRWAVGLAIPPLVVCFVAPSIVLHVWPEGSDAAIAALRITCVAQLACTAVGGVNYLLIMAGFQRQTLLNGIPAIGLNLVLCFTLVPRLGVTGAAIANGVAMVTANGIGMWQVWRALGIHPFEVGLLKPLIAAVPAGAAVWAIARLPGPPIVIAPLAGIGAIVVFLLAFRLLGLDEDDRSVVLAVRRRVGR